MSVEDNKALFRRLLEEAFTNGNVDIIDELIAEDVVDHEELPPGLSGPPREQLKQFVAMWKAAFPDGYVEISDIIAEGDRVVSRSTLHGTHSGEFLGIPPSGNQINYEIIDIARIVDGKCVEHWAASDNLKLLQQLGAMPVEAPAPA